MGLKAIDGFPAGGVDSRSNPIVMPVDRYLLVRDLWPREDGSFQLRDGYSFLAPGLQPGIPIHSIVSVTGPGPDYKPLIVFWQNLTPYIYDTIQQGVLDVPVRGQPITSSTRFSYFYANGHLHAFNGRDAKWFDGFVWRDIGLPLPPADAIGELQVVESVREFSTAEAAAVTLTLAGGGTFLADKTGRSFFAAYYDLDLQEVGPATIPLGPNAGVVKFGANQELQVGGLPNISAAHARWKKILALTGDGNQKARFATSSTKQITDGALVNQTYALSKSAASNNPGQFPSPSFDIGLSASDLSLGPATATVNGAEQSAPDNTVPATLDATITGVDRSIEKIRIVGPPGGNQTEIDYTLPDFGHITLSITGSDGFAGSWATTYGPKSTPGSLAFALASSINASSAATRFLAEVTGGQLVITILPGGSGVLYQAAVSSLTSNPTDFGAGSTSFPVALSSASFGQRTIYDAGTVTIVINGHNANASYGASDTPATIADVLASAINALGIGVSASVAGATITISQSNTSVQIQLTVVGNGMSADDVVGLSNTGDSSYDGKICTVLTATTDTITINVPGASNPIKSGTVQKLLTVSAAGTTGIIVAPVFFTPYLVNADRGIAASTIGGAQPGYEFYASLYMPNAGKHVGNRVKVGQRIAPAVRTNVRILNPVSLTDTEQVLLLGRTSDGAEVPYAVVDLNANWVTWSGVGPSFLIDNAKTDGSSELPSRNFPPPGTLDYNAQIAALAGQLNLPQQAQVSFTFSRAWVESDHCCGTIENSPTIYRSGSALDMREGVFVGLPEQSWDPNDIETFPTGKAVTSGHGYNQESWVYSKHECAALMELAGKTGWEGPWNVGCPSQFGWTVGWRSLPYWITGKKQLATISSGGYVSEGGTTSQAAAGPITISDEYETALLSKIGNLYLDEVEIAYIRHPVKRVDVLRIKCRDANGFPFTVIHDFRLRDDRSPFGQAYLENLVGSVSGWFAAGVTLSRANGVVSAVFESAAAPDLVPTQFVGLQGWDDIGFDGEFAVTAVNTAGGNTTIQWAQAGPDAESNGGLIAAGPTPTPADFTTPDFTEAVIRDANDEEQAICGGRDGNLYLLYSGSDDDGTAFEGQALALRYIGPQRTAIKHLEWYGDSNARWFYARRLNTPFDAAQMTELTNEGEVPESVQGEDGDSHWRVTISTPEIVHAYVLLKLKSHVEDGSTVLNDPPHMPVENYGRVWMVTPLAGASRGK